MSEDSSSDDDCSVFTKRQMGNEYWQAKCWECGKQFRNLTKLISHYKNHNIKATCHICKVTFRRLTSLSTHLDNAHSPPLCKKCHQSFSNLWELNKHAETLCRGSATFQEGPSLTSTVMYQSQNSDREGIEMRPATSENSVEYIVGEDDKDIYMESPHETGWTDDSTSSDTDDEDETCSQPADMCPNDPESDDGSNSSATDCSSDSTISAHSEITPATLPYNDSAVCSACGRGPFNVLKLHLLHCRGIRVSQCTLCNTSFPTELSLSQHYITLYYCDICGQVFSNKNFYNRHDCPKGDNSPYITFCSESMPKVCNLCRAFFTSEKTLLNHVTKVHTSVVSTKRCIITDPAALTNIKLPPGVSGAAARPATSSSGPALVSSITTCQNPKAGKQVINGKLSASQTYVVTVANSSSSSLGTSSSHRGRPHAPNLHDYAAAPVRSDLPINQPSCRSATDTTPATPVAHPVSHPVSIPTIMAMFENDSHEVALMKRMSTGWRSKAPYPCRQCGAISRQPSFIISHRYLHRGRRSHRCQCGRAFKHRLHLLRHCVQHAEAISYICVNCGESFTGAKLLAEHMKGKSQKKSSSSGHTWKRRVKRKCKMPFICDCGQLFVRPSAYIWHLLKNETKTI